MIVLGSEATFLEFNRDNIFSNLIQAEGHFRSLESGVVGRGEFLSCVSKHLAYVEGEAEEAVSHSLVVEGPHRSREYAALRNEARHLRKRIQGGDVTVEEGIRGVRRVRSLFERMNPLFDTDKCRSCGSVETFVEELTAFDEKGLYAPSATYRDSDSEMKSETKDIALVVGGVNIGWGIGYTAKAFIDPMAPGAIMGQDPSLLIDVGGTIAAIIGAMKLRGSMAKKLSTYIAAGLSTHIWEDLTKILAPAAAVTVPSPTGMGAPMGGVRPVGEMIPGIPAYPTPAPRLAGYPFPSPVSVGGTMSPPHYTLNGVPGAPRTVSLAPKYTLDTF